MKTTTTLLFILMLLKIQAVENPNAKSKKENTTKHNHTFIKISKKIFSSNSSKNANYDTNFVKDLGSKLQITSVLTQKKFSLTTSERLTQNKSVLSAKSSLYTGLSIDWKWLSVEYTFPLKFISKNCSNYYNLSFGLTGRKLWFSSNYQEFKGINLVDNKKTLSKHNDVSVSDFKASLYYSFNNTKYSHRAPLWQFERQLRSAGSFAIGTILQKVYIKPKSNSSTADMNQTKPITDIQKSTLSINAGYAYNYILYKYLCIHGSFFPGVSLQKDESKNNETSKVSVGGSLEYRCSIGYNNDRFFCGMWYLNTKNISSMKHPNSKSNITSGYLRFYLGYRLDV